VGELPYMLHDSIFVVKTSLFFCGLSAAFSLLGLFLEPKAPIANPLPGFTVPEISGHLLWGLVAGAATLSLRYTLMGGAFAVLIDSDHLVGLTHLEAVSRMSHSIFFGIIALVLSMVLFGKKDYRLGAVAFSAVLAHISFDIFYRDYWFPFFAPIYNNQVYFGNIYWVIFEAAAISIVGMTTVLTRYQKKIVQKV
jgi:hypothetical protein